MAVSAPSRRARWPRICGAARFSRNATTNRPAIFPYFMASIYKKQAGRITAGPSPVDWGNPAPPSAEFPLPHRFQMLDDLPGHRLGIAIEHAAVVGVEQGILDARVTRALATLDDDHVLRLVGI